MEGIEGCLLNTSLTAQHISLVLILSFVQILFSFLQTEYHTLSYPKTKGKRFKERIELQHLPVQCSTRWLVSSVGRALHWYRRGDRV